MFNVAYRSLQVGVPVLPDEPEFPATAGGGGITLPAVRAELRAVLSRSGRWRQRRAGQ